MALNKKPVVPAAQTAPADTTVQKTAPFEANPDEGQDDPQEAAAAPGPAPAASRTVAPAAAPASRAVSTNVSTRRPGVLSPLKDAIVVEYNTFPALQVNQGNWLIKEGKKMLGDGIDFELLSFQDQWVISPGVEGAEGLEHLRFSADGEFTTKGEDCREYLAELHAAGFAKADMKHRAVLVLNLISCDKKVPAEYLDKLYQVDLPPSSKSKFDAHRHQADFSVSRNRCTPEAAPMIRSTVTVIEKGTNSWSVADFTFSALKPV